MNYPRDELERLMTLYSQIRRLQSIAVNVLQQWVAAMRYKLDIAGTLVTTSAFVPNYIGIKMNSLL